MKTESPWLKTKVANLYKYKPAGTYWMKASIHGQLVRKSLKTTSFVVAGRRLKKMHSEESGRIPQRGKEPESVGVLIDEYLARNKRDQDVAASTRDVREDLATSIKKIWPELAGVGVSDLSPSDCQKWADTFRAKYSPGRYNAAVDVLRAILEPAVERGFQLENPAAKVKKAKARTKEISMPSKEDYHRLLSYYDTRRRRSGRVLIQFLASTGMRIGEARKVLPEHIEWDNDRIHIPGPNTKSKRPRFAPIIPELKPVLERLLAEYATSGQAGPLMPVGDIHHSLKAACVALKIPHMNHHRFRHLFLTRCIESGVDIKTLIEWAGHRNAKLILETYAHLRNEHSQSMARLVKFG